MKGQKLVRIGLEKQAHVAVKRLEDRATALCGQEGKSEDVQEAPGRALLLCARCLQILTSRGKS